MEALDRHSTAAVAAQQQEGILVGEASLYAGSVVIVCVGAQALAHTATVISIWLTLKLEYTYF